MKPKYYKARLWKISARLSRIGRHCWRYIKFYEHREAVGAPWRIVHHAAYETRTSP